MGDDLHVPSVRERVVFELTAYAALIVVAAIGIFLVWQCYDALVLLYLRLGFRAAALPMVALGIVLALVLSGLSFVIWLFHTFTTARDVGELRRRAAGVLGAEAVVVLAAWAATRVLHLVPGG